jgi:hypothetical protein
MKAYYDLHKIFCKIALMLLLPLPGFSQNITYSEPVKDDTRNMNFEIMGRMKGNILVFKNSKSNYAINIYDGEMQLKENRALDFLPAETFNVDFISYTDSFYLIYQFKKKGIVHCVAVKLNAEAKLITDPIELDATKIDWLSDSKIYTTISSDDKKRIMIFKIERKSGRYNFETLLFDNNLKPIHQSRQSLEFDSRLDILSDFFVDNDGNFVFVKSTKAGNRDDIIKASLIVKPPLEDTFQIKNITLNNTYIDEVNLKVDNANKHYLINSLYYDKRHGSIEGIFCNIWDRNTDSSIINTFIPFNDSLRSVASTDASTKYAFDDFFIRNVIVKKDGGYLLTAEDYYTKSNDINNPWDRWDYLYGSPYGMTAYNYYNYNPTYNWYYRPYNDPYYGQQSVRYFYNNVLILNIDKTGNPQWANILQKQQYADNDDNYLSFLTFNINGEIHFLFNEINRRNTLLNDNTYAADGVFSRNPPLKTMDNDYQFMPKFGKQVGANQVVVPCIYRNSICFAKIDY